MSYVTPHFFDTAYNLTVSSGDELSSNLVTTVGLAEIDDGEGGIFAWSPTSLETDDGTNVIQPSSVSGAGRWLRVSGQPSGSGTFTIPITFEDDVTFETDVFLDDASVITFDDDATIARSATGLQVATTITNGNGIEGLAAGLGSGVKGTGGGTATAAGGEFYGSAAGGDGVYAVGTLANAGVEAIGGATDGSIGVTGTSSATNGRGGSFTGTGTGYGVTGTGIDGYGVVAASDTTSPIKAALHVTPQNAAPSSPVEGNVYSDSVTHALCHYDGSNWVETGARYATASIASADIVGTSAGQLGHANGVVIVPSPGAGYAIEFLSGVVILDFAGAAYTGGGNVTFNYAGGGAAVSTIVSNANSVTGAADKVALVLATAPTNNQLTAATGLNLVSASAPTQPGGATGVLRVKVSYRVHATGL